MATGWLAGVAGVAGWLPGWLAGWGWLGALRPTHMGRLQQGGSLVGRHWVRLSCACAFVVVLVLVLGDPSANCFCWLVAVCNLAPSNVQSAMSEATRILRPAGYQLRYHRHGKAAVIEWLPKLATPREFSGSGRASLRGAGPSGRHWAQPSG